MAEGKKLVRRKKDGSGYEALSYGPGGASYDRHLGPDAAKQAWVRGYEEVEEDSPEFEALRLLAGADSSMGLPSGVALKRRDDGDFDLERTYSGGASMGQRVPRGIANSLTNLGGERVSLTAPPALEQDPGDAKRDGLSNPSARPAQDWVDAPKYPMPPAGAKAKGRAPSISVGMPAQGLNLASRVPGEATRSIRAPGRSQQASPEGVMSAVDPYGDARAAGDRRRLGVALARAGGMVNEALSGARLDRAAYDDLEGAADAPVRDFAARRVMSREDAQARGDADERRLRAEDYARRWTRQGEQDAYGRERDKAGDTLARDRMAADEQRWRAELAARGADRAEARAARLDARTLAGQERADRAEAAAIERRGRKTEEDAQALAKRTEDAGLMKDDLDTIVRALDKGGDIPGVGPVVSALPEFFLSAEGTNLRSAAMRLYRNAVRMESGQTVTPQEAASALAAYGMGTGKSETAFRQGMGALAQRARRAMQNAEAGFRPEVVDLRQQRGGVTSRDIPQPAGPGPTPTGRVKRSGGRVFMEMSDGSAQEMTRG